MGLETSDDAAVYKVSDSIALIQTVDFFTPVVDDPYLFGQIAAANALSDVYAMGGEPILALNIVGFPDCQPTSVLAEILRGGADKVKEAGAVLAGGHSIQDAEPKYGLSVTGFVHPERVLKNAGAEAGDVLLLTKPLGSGILNTAVKAELASAADAEEVVKTMAALNKKARDVMVRFSVHSCTDITGFGLAGHGLEMAKASDVSLEIDLNGLPVLSGAMEYASMGLVPGGAYRNREYVGAGAAFGRDASEADMDIVFDPQTSGGLLIALPEAQAGELLSALEGAGMETPYARIGRVTKRKEAWIYFC